MTASSATAVRRAGGVEHDSMGLCQRLGGDDVGTRENLNIPSVKRPPAAGRCRLSVADRAAAEATYDEILASARTVYPDEEIYGCLVAPMVTGGVETILAVQRDPVFAPIIMFGFGGIFVEASRKLPSAPPT